MGSVSVEVADAKQMDAVRDQIGYLLISRHKISDPTNADFTIFPSRIYSPPSPKLQKHSQHSYQALLQSRFGWELEL